MYILNILPEEIITNIYKIYFSENVVPLCRERSMRRFVPYRDISEWPAYFYNDQCIKKELNHMYNTITDMKLWDIINNFDMYNTWHYMKINNLQNVITTTDYCNSSNFYECLSIIRKIHNNGWQHKPYIF